MADDVRSKELIGLIGPVEGVDGAEIARLREEIAMRRQRLDSALRRLERRVSEDLDWRSWVAARPWVVLAVAAAAGFALGSLTGHRQSLPEYEEL